MSDWCAWFEKRLLRAKQVLIDEKQFKELDDEDFERLLLQLRRMRKGEWRMGQI